MALAMLVLLFLIVLVGIVRPAAMLWPGIARGFPLFKARVAWTGAGRGHIGVHWRHFMRRYHGAVWWATMLDRRFPALGRMAVIGARLLLT